MEVLTPRELAQEVQSRLKMSDGFDMFYRRWKSAGEVESALIFLHGIGGHSGVYGRFAQDMASNRVEVYAPDMRGYANSKEDRLPMGDSTSKPDRWLKDLDEMVALVRSNHPGKKVFAMGHSTGGAVILWYAAQRPDSVDGLILAAPGVKLAASGFRVAVFGLKMLLLRLFAPKRMIDLIDAFLPEEERSKETFRMLSKDPLWTPKISPRFMFRLGPVYRALQYAPRVTVPTLIIHGEADRVALPEGSKELIERLAVKDRSLKTFPGADHFLYDAFGFKPTSKYDPAERKEVAALVSSWIKAH